MFKYLIRKINNRIKVEKVWWSEYRKYTLTQDNSNRIFLVNTPVHGNLGDHALTIAEYNLLAEIAPTHEIIELPGFMIRDLSANRLKKIVKQSPLLLNAGGYLGTLWMIEEQTVRKFLSTFHTNPIAIMPQTITYSNSNTGQREKQISKEYYDKCQYITLFVRDEKSIPEAHFLVGEQNVILVPDMVVGYMSHDFFQTQREKKCLLCMRNDVEKSIQADTLITFKQIIANKIPDISILETDTVVQYNIDKDQRKTAVKSKLAEFASAQLIITDRLHGMLFAAITSTPCIVFNNSNGKVKGVYNWIKEIPYVKFVDNLNDFESVLIDVLECKNTTYPTELMKQKYIKMEERLRDIISFNINASE